MSDDPGLVKQQAQGNYIAQATHGGVANVQVVLPPAPVQEQNRVRFLKRLSAEYERQWEQALQGARPMMLGLTSRPDAVRHHTEKFFRGPNLPERQLPADTSVVEIYNQSGHELLILGEPGAGKSTLLLELARHLVESAQQDQQQPFPIILPLSSWAVKQPPFVGWLAEQLALIYDVPHQLGRQWVQADQILPLLDGLDEMPQGARAACIEAIGAYRKEHLVPMVVCSRQAEYEEIRRQKRLVLQSVVVVQPLTQEQVDAYLLRTDQALASVRAVLDSNTILRDLTTTPLMLNVLTQTYTGAVEQALPSEGTADEQQRQVLAAYVQQMVRRKGDEGGDTHLADIFGYGVLGGYLGWLWSVPVSQKSVPSQKRVLRSLWRTRLIVSVFVGLLFGILIGPYYGFGAGWRGGLIFGISMGLSIFLLQLLFAKETQGIGSTTGSSMQQGSRLASFLRRVHIRRVLLVAVVFGWSYGLSEGLSYGLSIDLSESLSEGLSTGLSYGLLEGLRYGLISMLISLVGVSSGTIYLTERLRWTWGSLKRSLFLPRHFFVTLFLACLIMILFGVGYGVNNNLGPGLGYELIYGLGYGLSVGLIYGLSYWFLLGLFQGIAHEQIEDQDRLTANQGVKRSLSNSIIMGATSGGMIGVAGILSTGLTYGLTNALIYNLGIAWSFDLTNGLINGLSGGLPAGLSGGCFVLLISGGLAVLRHYVIRFLLWRSQVCPWRAVAFLDDATVRGLLRRVGGGYSFGHRLLLDYLADREYV